MSVFEEIAKRTPINRQAFDVSSRGNHFSFEARRLNRFRTDIPPAIIEGQLSDEEDFTGRVFGRLTVIGRSKDTWVKDRKVRWIVRCACGFYERMRSRVLRSLRPDDHMCSSCKLLEQRKRGFGPWTKVDGNGEPIPSINPAIIPVVEKEKELPIFQRRTRLSKVPIPPELRWKVWERDNFTCLHCGTRKNLSVDHILAESKGGLMVLENLQTLCKPCNSRKGVN